MSSNNTVRASINPSTVYVPPLLKSGSNQQQLHTAEIQSSPSLSGGAGAGSSNKQVGHSKKITKEERSIFKLYSFDMESCLSTTTNSSGSSSIDSQQIITQSDHQSSSFSINNTSSSSLNNTNQTTTSSNNNSPTITNSNNTNNTPQSILSLFKQFLEVDNCGRYVPLFSLFLQMKHNPSYYDNSLYSEKKWEIECFLKHDAFPRFIRTDAFKLYIINRLRSIRKNTIINNTNSLNVSNTNTGTYMVSPRNNTESSTTLSIHSDHFNNLVLGNRTMLSPRSLNSLSGTQSSMDDSSTFIGGSTDSNAILDLNNEPNNPSINSNIGNNSRPNDVADFSTLKDTSKLDGELEGNAFAISSNSNHDVIDNDLEENEHDEHDENDTNSTTATSTSGISFGHHHQQQLHSQFENHGSSRLHHSNRRKSKESSTSVLSNRNVSDFLNMLAIPVSHQREPLFKSLAEMKSSLFLSVDHINFINSLMLDSPDWDIIYTIPSNMEAVNSNKCIPAHVHKDYLSRNGVSFSFSMISKNANRKVHPDLPIDKVSTWKYHTYLPFTHHEVFQMLERKHFIISKVKKSKGTQLGTELLDTHFNVSGSGNRQFYCYNETINVPNTSGTSLFSRFSGSGGKELNLLATNFYDSQKSEYIVCVKSEGYDNPNMEVMDNTWGLKIMKITKITNTLTRLSECGMMYFGDSNTRDFFLSNLVNTSQKDKKTFMYNALVLGCLEIKMEISQQTSKLSQQSVTKTISPIRAKCLTMNGQIFDIKQ